MLKISWFHGSVAIAALFVSACLGSSVDGKPADGRSEIAAPTEADSARLSLEAASEVINSDDEHSPTDDDYSATKDIQPDITLCEPPRGNMHLHRAISVHDEDPLF